MYTRKQADLFRNIINGNIRSFYDERFGRDIQIVNVYPNAKTALCECCEIEYDSDFDEETENIYYVNFTFNELSHFEVRG